MKRFSGFLNRLGVDMGSSQVRIYNGEKMLLAEASCACVDNLDGHVLGFGMDAQIRYHHAPENTTLEWPVQNGMIANYEMTKAMMRYFLNKSLHHSVSRPEVMVSIPGEISSVTRHALVDALIHAGAQQVFLIPSAAAAAIGAGKDLSTPAVALSMVTGRDVSDVGIYGTGGIVAQEGIPFGGHQIDVGICQYLLDTYHMMIGLTQAEQLKSDVLSLSGGAEEKPFTVRGRRISDGVEVVIELSTEEMSPVMKRIMQPILTLMRRILSHASPEMAEDFLKNGLLLSGGGALLSGITDWLTFELGIPVRVPEDPGDVIALGCYAAFEKEKELSLLIENGEKYYGN